MQNIGELQTNKAKFFFKKTQDFYQTTHAATHQATIITNNIILYFYCKLFVLHLFKRSRNGTSRGEGGYTLDIFVECGYFYAVLISPLFSNMADRRTFHDLDM